MIKTVLFDLDGTLLPMDQDKFIQDYLGRMAAFLAPHGYVPQLLLKAVMAGTQALVKNDGHTNNDVLFWQVFSHVLGRDARQDADLLTQFYLGEFQQVRHSCGFDPRAAETVRSIRDMGLNTILATNPLFPAVATHSRLRWAGLEPEEFLRITTYENSRFCKPNPDYYRQLLEEESLLPEECLMVGNDVREDMVAQSLGMEVFLLTDCLINTENRDLSAYPQGSFPELMAHIRKLTAQ